MTYIERESPRSSTLTNRSDRQQETDRGGIYDGTVGWQDGAKHYDTESGGVTLVKVTLFEGRDPDADRTENSARAHGHQILARISAPLFYVPEDGAQVLVAFAAGRMAVPGGGVIIAVPGVSPAAQFSPNKAKLDFGATVDLVIKARSVTISDYSDRYLTLGPKYGLKIGDADANGCQLMNSKWAFYTAEDGAATTAFQLARAGIKLMINDGQMCAMTMKAGTWVGMGTKFEAQFPMGALGKLPPLATPATFGLAYSAVGPVNLFSATWCVSP